MSTLGIQVAVQVQDEIAQALRHAGVRKTGGMLFGEVVTPHRVRIIEATVEGEGSFASFTRRVSRGKRFSRRFMKKHAHAYQQYNYVGEWHSHPSFTLSPSITDSESMRGILQEIPHAHFVLLLIVRLREKLEIGAFCWQRG